MPTDASATRDQANGVYLRRLVRLSHPSTWPPTRNGRTPPAKKSIAAFHQLGVLHCHRCVAELSRDPHPGRDRRATRPERRTSPHLRTHPPPSLAGTSNSSSRSERRERL